jgi:antitoxin component of RelBE/YafQ-DinJ toxin-antitoxin module
MPNYRDPDKTHLSAWIRRQLKADLQALAKSRGMSVSDVVVTLLENEVAEWKKQVPSMPVFMPQPAAFAQPAMAAAQRL